MAGYTARQVGAPNTLDYRVFIGMCQMGYGRRVYGWACIALPR